MEGASLAIKQSVGGDVQYAGKTAGANALNVAGECTGDAFLSIMKIRNENQL
ncbi:hypothetical protein T11_11110 [Trichinella zimbabwensis]|uniref:Uncharacterized protein n=1 Tax=Trichinella zimbabwensis TaxID=268475 RepID=A0A0V1I5U6_9BILA|nr:hypothetical protein T11_11110 [Trichinella zimbabwensis]